MNDRQAITDELKQRTNTGTTARRLMPWRARSVIAPAPGVEFSVDQHRLGG
jgi:hypothetical protein